MEQVISWLHLVVLAADAQCGFSSPESHMISMAEQYEFDLFPTSFFSYFSTAVHKENKDNHPKD